jgi:molecular chaperone GrpE
MVLSLLDVLDDFERALEHMDEAPASISAGLSAIYQRLAGLLEAQGVTPFESVGQPFDPALHEAVGSVESNEQESGAVIDELRRGYRWGEELLRPARVRVAR